MKKRLLAVLVAAVTAVSLLACGGGSSAGSTGSAESGSGDAAASDMKVAMVTDYGDITDQSFNQTTYEACKAFAEANNIDFTYYKPEGDSTADRVAMIDKAVADGYNVLVLPGYAFAEAIVESAETYTDTKFVALDVSEYDLCTAAGTETYSQDNVYSAVYEEQISGYMAGYAAVKMGYKKLGFLGGMAVPAVIRYGYGFVAGANDAAKEMGLTDVAINYAYGNQFFGDADITAAMDTWYKGGTEVVFACGGGIYTSAAEAAAKENGKFIGVDVDQKALVDGQYGEGMTITSAMKGLGATVNTLLTAIMNGEWDSYKGQIQSLGIVSGDDPTLNYVQIPMDTTVWNDGFTQDDYKALVKGLADGSVTVTVDASAEQPAADTVTINFQGNIK
ncbi:MAG TPA: BMP family ABC transporter substrate-binding protein [Lachnospiraceae bacterium]|nr:BMP family ABC transporter substrate-binding protein [Lachnospiraceae bacterium]